MKTGLWFWNKRANKQVIRLTTEKTADITIRITNIQKESKGRIKSDVVGLAIRRWHIPNSQPPYCEIQLNKNRWHGAVLAHELGHCFGLKHTVLDDFIYNSVMNQRPIRKSIGLARHLREIARINAMRKGRNGRTQKRYESYIKLRRRRNNQEDLL